MTIINGIEIDYINYNKNLIKEAIQNNEPIEDKLNVIAVISNPYLFARRFILMKEFINRIELEETNVNLYIVEYDYDYLYNLFYLKKLYILTVYTLKFCLLILLAKRKYFLTNSLYNV